MLRTSWIVLALALALCVACGDADETTDAGDRDAQTDRDAADHDAHTAADASDDADFEPWPFRVLSTSIVDGQYGVSTRPEIVIRFSAPTGPTGWVAFLLRHSRTADGEFLRWNERMDTVTVRPDREFLPGERVLMSINNFATANPAGTNDQQHELRFLVDARNAATVGVVCSAQWRSGGPEAQLAFLAYISRRFTLPNGSLSYHMTLSPLPWGEARFDPDALLSSAPITVALRSRGVAGATPDVEWRIIPAAAMSDGVDLSVDRVTRVEADACGVLDTARGPINCVFVEDGRGQAIPDLPPEAFACDTAI